MCKCACDTGQQNKIPCHTIGSVDVWILLAGLKRYIFVCPCLINVSLSFSRSNEKKSWYHTINKVSLISFLLKL